MRGRFAAVLLASGLGAVASFACLDSPAPVNCQQFAECAVCTMESACSFCLETNQCIADSQVCGGDRAQTPDMCEGDAP
jgi:hypothetical protein